MSLVTVKNLSFSYGSRKILNDASFRLLKGEHIGLIGANGEGKSTFINILLGNITPDAGKVEWAKRLKIGYLDQYTSLSKGKSIREVLREAFNYLFELEKEIGEAYNKMNDCSEEEMDDLLEDIGEMQSIIEHGGFYEIDARISSVAAGLGLFDIGLDRDVSELSGGQRSKVLLTKLLLEDPHILILDEPTNFLDENHINWLVQYLTNFENAFLLITHDMAFLNKVSNIIYHIENLTLTRYTGNYDFFVKQHELKKQQFDASYEAQQREIKELEDFIARNKARVATRNMANSRQKKLDKMEIIERTSEKVKPNFKFKEARTPGKVIFDVKDLIIGYDHPLSSLLNLEFIRNEKVAIKGVNGIGKSTLIKTLIGIIPPLSGKVERDPFLEIGYFEQEAKDDKKTALNEIWDAYPTMSHGEVRGALASCGLSKDHVDSLMKALSGGENAKVRICSLMLKQCNVLILDEPTNHLDVLAKEALKEALLKFNGSIILISHEPEFYNGLVDKIINLEEYSTKII